MEVCKSLKYSKFPPSQYPWCSRQDPGRVGVVRGGGGHRCSPPPTEPGGCFPAEQLGGGLRLSQDATPDTEHEEEDPEEEEEAEEEEVRAGVGLPVQLGLCQADGSVPLAGRLSQVR